MEFINACREERLTTMRILERGLEKWTDFINTYFDVDKTVTKKSALLIFCGIAIVLGLLLVYLVNNPTEFLNGTY